MPPFLEYFVRYPSPQVLIEGSMLITAYKIPSLGATKIFTVHCILYKYIPNMEILCYYYLCKYRHIFTSNYTIICISSRGGICCERKNRL